MTKTTCCLFLSIISSVMFCYAQSPGSHYFYISGISRESGLSHSQVKTIFKDSRGFLWFGTYAGLNRYDGYKCEKYLVNKGEEGLFQNIITHSIYEDNDGYLWIGASGSEVFRYDSYNELISAYPLPASGQFQSSSLNHTFRIRSDHKDNIWFATTNGLYKLCRDSDTIIPYKAEGLPESIEVEALGFESSGRMWVGTKGQGLFLIQNNKAEIILDGLINPFITDIAVEDDQLWIATAGGGLFGYSLKTNEYKQFPVKDLPEGALPNLINEILVHGTDLYLATFGGIFIFDSTNEQFDELGSQVNFPQYPQNTGFNSLYLDDQNVLWAATQTLGVYKYYLYHDLFGHIIPFPERKDHPGNIIHSLVEINDNELLMGTEGGLILYDEHKNMIRNFRPERGNDTEFIITRVLPYSDDWLLIGTWNHGLWMFNPDSKVFMQPEAFKDHEKYSQIFDILVDSDKTVWLGLHEEGLLKLDSKLDILAHYTPGDSINKISSMSVRRLFQDKTGNIWLGHLSNGIDILNKATNNIRNIINDYSGKSQISNNDIISFFEDSKGNIWIGTNGGGVNLYIYEQEKFIHLSEKDRMVNDVVFSILEDSHGHIWLQTNRGISRMNYYEDSSQSIPQVRNFNIEDGLPTTEFHFTASLKSSKGKFYFPSRHGIVCFYPHSLVKSDIPPKIIITRIEINNKSISEYADEIKIFPETKNPIFLESVTLNHNLNRISIEYSALDFFKSSDNQYLVKLDGFDDDWVSMGSNRTTSYINLPHGKYSLHILAGNSRNIWNDTGISLEITIKPPWWITWWAYLIYSTILVVAFIMIRALIIRKERIRSKNRIERLKQQKERELDKFKLDFFTKITHEIRTPITLIMGPIEKMMHKEREDKKEQKYFQILKSNSEKLYQLTNEILDLRKIDESRFTIHKTTDDLIPLMQGIKERFLPFAESRNISLNVESNFKSIYWEFDTSVIDRIVSNLISNAIKFTGPKGSVRVLCKLEEVSNQPDQVIIEVNDTGKGIAREELDQIFKPFYQTGSADNQVISGTGLGLALVKELTDMHEGRIEVLSEESNGSTFKLYFTNHLAQPDHIHESSISSIHAAVAEEEEEEQSTENKGPESVKSRERILVVEDNEELNEFLVTVLTDKYNVSSCYTGVQGYSKAVESIPDLIISDLMMPDMNGIDMCHKLKKEALTCHIPIIMLTVLSSEENQISGFEAGADDYITKPFNTSILLMKVRNILTLKSNLRLQFARAFIAGPNAGEVKKEDPLIERIIAFIEENLDDPELNISRLSKEIGVGRSQFFIKIKNITGLTVSEMIKGIRLKKAYEYLSTGDYNVSEVCYQVGFKNISHFTRCFKLQFGYLPSSITKQTIDSKKNSLNAPE